MSLREPLRRLVLNSLGFTEEPFSRSADPRFLFLSTQHGQVLDLTLDVIEQRNGLAVVEGRYGVGKTSVARRLLSLFSDEPGYVVVYAHSSAFESEYAALMYVCNYLGLPPRRGLSSQWMELEHYLIDKTEQGKNIVIIFDDAHKMGPEGLDFAHRIYNFDITKKLAQLILFGQPEISKVFRNKDEVLDRVDSWFRLNPLSLEDTLNLIRFRCGVAGRSEPLLTSGAFLQVFEITKGIPRPIIFLCSKIVDVMGEMKVNIANEEVVEVAAKAFLEKYPDWQQQQDIPEQE